MQFIFIISVIIFIVLAVLLRKKKPFSQPEPGIEKRLLEKHVTFYKQLDNDDKEQFLQRVQLFLQKVRITGVKTTIEDIDRVFIAAAAIIPIFAFKGWQYQNIHEVLVYPGSFNEDFEIEGTGRDVLGMVGNGPMQNVMLLSQQNLRDGFFRNNDTSNTAIHEFVHLVDKTDGDTDGYPRALLPHKYTVPWIKRIHKEIELIRAGQSDINPYGATNEAEFLAVAAEYFFEKPHLMEQRHPGLYQLLLQIFVPSKLDN
ncbi:MAG: zinc-dependent peptidase [Bacteroidota bacterium]